MLNKLYAFCMLMVVVTISSFAMAKHYQVVQEVDETPALTTHFDDVHTDAEAKALRKEKDAMRALDEAQEALKHACEKATHAASEAQRKALERARAAQESHRRFQHMQKASSAIINGRNDRADGYLA